MARSHSTDGKPYINPEVRFERGDIEYQGVVIFGAALSVGLVLIVLAMFWYGRALRRDEASRKVTDLPPASVDQDRQPPEPRFEALDDLREGNVKLFPPRAEEYLSAQRRLLEEGDPNKGIEPIREAIGALAGRLPAKEQAAPTNFGPDLPSKASAGRTGGP